MKKTFLILSLLPLAAAAQQAGRDNFARQQAYAEMQRVTGQVDVLQNNFEELQRRIGRLEGGSGENRGIRAEIDSLRSSISELRREMQNLRGEIVRELSAKLVKIQRETAPAPAPAPTKKKVVIGPHQEYIVRSGDTLSLISEAFGCSVRQIKEMNNLKGDGLRVGQKLMLPQ